MIKMKGQGTAWAKPVIQTAITGVQMPVENRASLTQCCAFAFIHCHHIPTTCRRKAFLILIACQFLV